MLTLFREENQDIVIVSPSRENLIIKYDKVLLDQYTYTRKVRVIVTLPEKYTLECDRDSGTGTFILQQGDWIRITSTENAAIGILIFRLETKDDNTTKVFYKIKAPTSYRIFKGESFRFLKQDI